MTTRFYKVMAMAIITTLILTGCSGKATTPDLTTETADVTSVSVPADTEPAVAETSGNTAGTTKAPEGTTGGTTASGTSSQEGTSLSETTTSTETTITETTVKQTTSKETSADSTEKQSTENTEETSSAPAKEPSSEQTSTEASKETSSEPATPDPVTPESSQTTPNPPPVETTPEPKTSETTPEPKTSETTPEPQKYDVYVASQAPEWGTATSIYGSYEAGTQFTIKATANAGYHFVEWWTYVGDVEGSISKDTYSFTVTDHTVFIARFEKDAEVAPTKPMTYYATADFEVYVRYYDANGDYHENVLLTKPGITVYTTDGTLTGGHFGLYGFDTTTILTKQLLKEYDPSATMEGFAGAKITNIRDERENP